MTLKIIVLLLALAMVLAMLDELMEALPSIELILRELDQLSIPSGMRSF